MLLEVMLSIYTAVMSTIDSWNGHLVVIAKHISETEM